MLTPPRLAKLHCPTCHMTHWEIDSDYRGADLIGQKELTYEERTYHCRGCGTAKTGYVVEEKSPPSLFLQPSSMYPMSVAEFELWVAVLRQHFPNHPRLQDVGNRW